MEYCRMFAAICGVRDVDAGMFVALASQRAVPGYSTVNRSVERTTAGKASEDAPAEGRIEEDANFDAHRRYCVLVIITYATGAGWVLSRSLASFRTFRRC